jgi:hypothetical protein
LITSPMKTNLPLSTKRKSSPSNLNQAQDPLRNHLCP